MVLESYGTGKLWCWQSIVLVSKGASKVRYWKVRLVMVLVSYGIGKLWY